MARLFSGGYTTLISSIAAIFAVLYIAEVDPEEYKAEESAVFTQSPEELFDYLTNADHVPQVSQLESSYGGFCTFFAFFQYFFFLNSLVEERPSQQISIGKIYTANVKIPIGKLQKLSQNWI